MTAIEPHHDDPQYWSARAISALRHFGGDLNRAAAHRLLVMWRDYRQLTEADISTVLLEFPNPHEPVTS